MAANVATTVAPAIISDDSLDAPELLRKEEEKEEEDDDDEEEEEAADDDDVDEKNLRMIPNPFLSPWRAYFGAHNLL